MLGGCLEKERKVGVAAELLGCREGRKKVGRCKEKVDRNEVGRKEDTNENATGERP